MRTIRPSRPKVLILLASLVFATVFCEFALRLSEGRRASGMIPSEVPQKWITPYAVFNRFPYPQEPSGKLAGETRVFVTGGSTVQWGEPPIPEILERDARQTGKRNVRVLNYGVISHNSGQELVQIILNIAQQSPDIIVMYNGANDVMDPLVFAETRPGYPYEFVVIENNPVLEPASSYPLIPLTLYGSALARRLFPNYFEKNLIHRTSLINTLRQNAGYGSDEWRDKIADIYVDNVLAAAKSSSAFGAEFFCFFQPLVHYKEPRNPAEISDPARRQHALALREKILSRVKTAAEGGTLHFVDLSDVFDGLGDRVFVDDIHIDNKFNQVIAHRMWQIIESHLANSGTRFTSGQRRNVPAAIAPGTAFDKESGLN